MFGHLSKHRSRVHSSCFAWSFLHTSFHRSIWRLQNHFSCLWCIFQWTWHRQATFQCPCHDTHRQANHLRIEYHSSVYKFLCHSTNRSSSCLCIRHHCHVLFCHSHSLSRLWSIHHSGRRLAKSKFQNHASLHLPTSLCTLCRFGEYAHDIPYHAVDCKYYMTIILI